MFRRMGQADYVNLKYSKNLTVGFRLLKFSTSIQNTKPRQLVRDLKNEVRVLF